MESAKKNIHPISKDAATNSILMAVLRKLDKIDEQYDVMSKFMAVSQEWRYEDEQNKAIVRNINQKVDEIKDYIGQFPIPKEDKRIVSSDDIIFITGKSKAVINQDVHHKRLIPVNNDGRNTKKYFRACDVEKIYGHLFIEDRIVRWKQRGKVEE